MRAITVRPAGRETRPAGIPVWDPLVRVFHWSLAIAFTVAWMTGDELERVHEVTGYVIAGLLAFRVVWGFIGTRYARFSDFVRRPSAALAYLCDEALGRAPRYIGHNPAGGAMVVALLATIATSCATGLLMTVGGYGGVEWVEEVHELAANFALVLVGLHLLGVVATSLLHRENLVRAMITGRKRAE